MPGWTWRSQVSATPTTMHPHALLYDAAACQTWQPFCLHKKISRLNTCLIVFLGALFFFFIIPLVTIIRFFFPSLVSFKILMRICLAFRSLWVRSRCTNILSSPSTSKFPKVFLLLEDDVLMAFPITHNFERMNLAGWSRISSLIEISSLDSLKIIFVTACWPSSFRFNYFQPVTSAIHNDNNTRLLLPLFLLQFCVFDFHFKCSSTHSCISLTCMMQLPEWVRILPPPRKDLNS